MKKIILSLVSIFVFASAFSQGIAFEHGTFNEALAKAKKENKLIFMDCYTSWCGPCKYLAKNIFTQDEVGAFFNKNFVSVKMDMESEAGKPLMEKYQISAYPTLLWLDAEGNIQHKQVGGGDANGLIATAKTAVDSENSWGALNKKFVAGERSASFLQNFILVSSKAGFDTKAAAEAYYAAKTPEQLINAKDAEILTSTVKSTSDSKFLFLLKNKEKFYAVSEKAQIDQFIEQTMSGELNMAMRNGDEIAIAGKKKELLSLDKEIGEKVLSFMNVNMLYRSPDKVKFYEALANHSIKYDFDNSAGLNKYAWMLAEAKEEMGKDLIGKALKMAKRSVELNSNFANIDTYACILNKAGRTEEAKIQAAKSIELAPEDQKKDLWSAIFLNEKN